MRKTLNCVTIGKLKNYMLTYGDVQAYHFHIYIHINFFVFCSVRTAYIHITCVCVSHRCLCDWFCVTSKKELIRQYKRAPVPFRKTIQMH